MTTRYWPLLLLLFPAQCLTVEKSLHSARCGTQLIRTGDPVTKLRRACGKPIAIDGSNKRQEYSYRLGRTGGFTVFRIKENRITDIRLVK